jgi:nicotinamide mononucleotide transporter
MTWSFDSILAELAASGPIEVCAVILALTYLVLAARLSLWCWPAAFVSSAIYLWLSFERTLYHQAVLQAFYVGMAVYGYWQWRGGSRLDPRPISTWSWNTHLVVGAGVLVVSLVTGYVEDRYTDATMPYLDAFTTWGSVVTTWMVTRKVLENWLYWLVVDSVLVYVFVQSGLVATALLFVVYLGIVIAGYFAWRRAWLRVPQPA